MAGQAKWYERDLAYIHDVGFGGYAARLAPGILKILGRSSPSPGPVIDLGCGSGILSAALAGAGYKVIGIDISTEMIRIARRKVPQARFHVDSLFTADLPRCSAVTCIGECINYLFDPQEQRQPLRSLFARVYRALDVGGIFIVDTAEPGQVASSAVTRSFSEGDDWTVLVEKQEDRRHALLTRRIVSFRRRGGVWRRSDETHRQRLYRGVEIAEELRSAGFSARTVRSFGDAPLPGAHAAVIARKPNA